MAQLTYYLSIGQYIECPHQQMNQAVRTLIERLRCCSEHTQGLLRQPKETLALGLL